jgi:hypothetical protein
MRYIQIKRILTIIIFTAGVAAAASAQQVIQLHRFRAALWKVHLTLNGKSGDFLFDTGAGVTHVTPEFANGLDCRFWGRNTGFNMFGTRADSPHCDDVQVAADKVALTDVSIGKHDFGEQFPGDKSPDGLLGLDAFDGKAITLDQAAATITIETPESLKKRVRNMTEMEFRLGRECSGRCLSAFLGIKTPAGMTWMNMDTGAGGVTLVAKDQAALYGLDPAVKEQRLKVDVAPGIVLDGPALVTDLIMDGNLGRPFLSKYVITLDLKNGRCWFGK